MRHALPLQYLAGHEIRVDAPFLPFLKRFLSFAMNGGDTEWLLLNQRYGPCHVQRSVATTGAANGRNFPITALAIRVPARPLGAKGQAGSR